MERSTGKEDKSFSYDYSFWSARQEDPNYTSQVCWLVGVLLPQNARAPQLAACRGCRSPLAHRLPAQNAVEHPGAIHPFVLSSIYASE
jgi:hypothetical protein